MGVEVVQTFGAESLTTVSAVKRRLRITGTDDDGLLADLVAEASAEVVSYCQRPFARARIRESNVSPVGRNLILTLTPVVEVHSVMRGGEPILDFRIEDAGSGVLSASGGLLSENESRWWNDPFVGIAGERYDVEYTGGYLTPQEPEEGQTTPPARTLPHDLEAAVIEMVGIAYSPDSDDRKIKSIKVDDITYQYAENTGQAGSALSITDRLDRWRRIA